MRHPFRRAAWYSLAIWSFMVAVSLAALPHARGLRVPTPAPGTPAKAQPRTESRTSASGRNGTGRTAAAPAAQPKQRMPSPLVGKGMWIYQLEKIAGGNPARIAHLARQANLTHIFVRVGSSVAGLKTLHTAASVLPHAHRLGIKVVAWYFPYFKDISGDLYRSLTAIRYRVRGHGFDGFAADIESATGSAMSAKTVREYSWRLRAAAPEMFLIAVPPRPTAHALKHVPYDAMMPHYDAVAPMVYWGRFDPIASVADTMRFFARWGKPIAPIGQAYDMSLDHSFARRGVPPAHELWAFMRTAAAAGATGVSFWSWQHADSEAWRAVRLYPWDGAPAVRPIEPVAVPQAPSAPRRARGPYPD